MPAEIDRVPPGSEPSAAAAQSWSFALFAVMTTIAIVTIALAAPMMVNELFDLAGGTQSAGTGGPAVDQQAAAMMSWAHLLAFQLTVVALTLLISSQAPGIGPGLAWRPPVGRMSWLQPFGLTVAVSIVTSVIALTFFADVVARDLEPIRALIAAAPLWLAALALCVGAPLSEELLFRGYLLHRLRRTPLGFWGGALTANIGWTLLHVGYSWLSLADVFLAGLLFTWALWRTASIWVPIAFHAIYNAAVLIMVLIPSQQSAVKAVWPLLGRSIW